MAILALIGEYTGSRLRPNAPACVHVDNPWLSVFVLCAVNEADKLQVSDEGELLCVLSCGCCQPLH